VGFRSRVFGQSGQKIGGRRGHAEKAQIQMMVRRLLPGCAIATPDAADALAVAICHAHHASTARAWQVAR
jgi:Holliday junction resolvasome RuvABC endonuclease subunit